MRGVTGPLGAIAVMRAAYDELSALPLDTLTPAELLGALTEVETLTRQLPAQSHRILARLHREASPVDLGATSWHDVLRNRLRIAGTDARRRMDDATELGPRTALSGEPLAPVLAQVAAAQAAGTINAEHVAIIRGFFDHLPGWVDPVTREQAETTPTRVARVPGYGTQVHHTTGWAKHHGHNNIDEEVLACPADNRLAEHGWTVHLRNGHAEWIPPPHLDAGQAHTNHYHHPPTVTHRPRRHPRVRTWWWQGRSSVVWDG